MRLLYAAHQLLFSYQVSPSGAKQSVPLQSFFPAFQSLQTQTLTDERKCKGKKGLI